MVVFRFYGDLNEFPTPRRQGQIFERTGAAGASVKDAIEACGVPHVEVDLVLVNGDPVGFEAILHHGDRVSVYPAFGLVGEGGGIRLLPAIPRPARFVLDIHLGRLSGRLRLLGFDTLYRNDWADAELAGVSAAEGRILLSRDVGVLKRKVVACGAWVRATEPDEQAVEVLTRFALADQIDSFSRCLRCNGVLADCDQTTATRLVPPRSRAFYKDFRRCPGCNRVYWPGSHHAALQGQVKRFCPSR